jgi:acyl carrier protein
MKENEILAKLEVLFREVFNDKSLIIRTDMTANDVDQWNSLTHMLLITEIEKEFQIRFKLKELNKMRNVGDMIELIQSKL